MSGWESSVGEERSHIPNKIRNDRMCIIGLPLSKAVNRAALVLNEACKLRQDSKYLPLVMHESATSKITNEAPGCLILPREVSQMFGKTAKVHIPKGRRAAAALACD